MRHLAAVLMVLALGCADGSLDQSKAAAVFASQPWTSDQSVEFSNEQVSCGVSAGLWESKTAGSKVGFDYWGTTPAGTTLGLGKVVDEAGHLTGQLKKGFSVSASVTSIVADPKISGRARVEATVAAKLSHQCFSTGLPFLQRKGAPSISSYVLGRLADGWHVVQ
jgi:hypothetical protein